MKTNKYNAADLFAGDQRHLPAVANELCGDILLQNNGYGETYHVKVRIWDKVNR
ncbi:hypothetical protein J2W55_004631 [Mucilaginibacter pocheonensis]|uniref:Uncharacterized protein n=1 Tax=Mucilaginibacter pocheonensis TaxID=398050 RepID=A0ABU1THP7_9SPHI|nr:hypothetical protein [Mucilaginibacter pocheonensis]